MAPCSVPDRIQVSRNSRCFHQVETYRYRKKPVGNPKLTPGSQQVFVEAEAGKRKHPVPFPLVMGLSSALE